MIRFATENDLRSVRSLFEACFPDESGFNELYFQNNYHAEHTLLLMEGDKLCAMTQMLPYRMQLGGQAGDATYIYGACTAPEARRNGYMAQLLERSFQLDRERGRLASVLIPQEAWLFGFYEKFGYRNMFSVTQRVFTASGAQPCGDIRRCGIQDIPQLEALYRAHFAHSTALLRSQSQWEQQLHMFDSLGAGVYGLWSNGSLLAYAFVWDGNEPWAQEFMATDAESADAISEQLCALLKCSSLKTTVSGDDLVLGVAKLYCENTAANGYMNLMFN